MRIADGRYARHGHNAGRKQSPTYRSWACMITRCSNPNILQWRDYGGRGITVCERWRVFANFLADMGPRPSRQHSLDRIDNSGNYEPSNCRWATRSEQRRNSRQGVVEFTVAGRTLCLSEWSRESGIDRRTIAARIYQLGWSPEEAVTLTPDFCKRAYR